MEDAAVKYALNQLGHISIDDLKEGQLQAIRSFLQKKDTLVILPTGHGKSLVYMTAAFCSDYISHSSKCGCDDETHIGECKNIALVISPLVALMRDQVQTLRDSNVSAVYAGEMTTEEEIALFEGKYSIVFASPETILGEKGSQLLSSSTYREKVCGIFVDESHCIAKWGFNSGKVTAFRNCYSRLAEIRSFVRSSTPVIALTATASESVKSIISSSLGLTNVSIIEQSPERTNIRYTVVSTCETESHQKKHFSWLTEELITNGKETQKILIFCKTHRNARNLHTVLTDKLPRDKQNHVALFTSVTEAKRKKDILMDYTKLESKTRILLATSAFGMGINVEGLHTVINYGASRDIDDYFQESGRVGRDGMNSHAILFNYRGNFGKGKTEKHMRDYVQDDQQCRRKVLVSHYGHLAEPLKPGHICCDVCSRLCDCGGDGCAEGGGVSTCEAKLRHCSTPSETKQRVKCRNVPDEVKEIIEDQLMIYRATLANERDGKRPHQLSGRDITSGFHLSLVKLLVNDCEYISSIAQLREEYPFFNVDHTEKVWLILEEIGGEAHQTCDHLGACACPVVTGTDSEDESDIDNLSDYNDEDHDDIHRILSTQFCRVILPVSDDSDDN